MSHFLHALVLFISVPSEIFIQSYSNIFVLDTNIHVRILADNICHLFVTPLMVTVIVRRYIILFRGILSSALNLIFM